MKTLLLLLIALPLVSQAQRVWTLGTQFDYGPGAYAGSGLQDVPSSGNTQRLLGLPHTITKIMGTVTVKSENCELLLSIFDGDIGPIWQGEIDSKMTITVNVELPWQIGGNIWVDWQSINNNWDQGRIPIWEYTFVLYGL